MNVLSIAYSYPIFSLAHLVRDINIVAQTTRKVFKYGYLVFIHDPIQPQRGRTAYMSTCEPPLPPLRIMDFQWVRLSMNADHSNDTQAIIQSPELEQLSARLAQDHFARVYNVSDIMYRQFLIRFRNVLVQICAALYKVVLRIPHCQLSVVLAATARWPNIVAICQLATFNETPRDLISDEALSDFECDIQRDIAESPAGQYFLAFVGSLARLQFLGLGEFAGVGENRQPYYVFLPQNREFEIF
ncbi:hypothetical protein GGS21DRAFT_312918 [Xylaria nigripes]|nr:hypothetical protein GGS21DRAFT_312918 [Xylaria nigripes]